MGILSGRFSVDSPVKITMRNRPNIRRPVKILYVLIRLDHDQKWIIEL